jgi:hypothetical protein
VIVVARPFGQLANRLFQYSHFVALAADTGVTVANPGLGADAAHFPAFAGDALCRYPAPRRNLPRALRPLLARAAGASLRGARALPGVRALDVPDGEDCDLEGARLDNRLVLAAGWKIRASGPFLRHRDEVKRVFTPSSEDIAAAEAAVHRAREAAPLVVGVHRRRGDYAVWQGGRYLFDDDQYAHVMRRAGGVLGGDVAFLVCSDEPLPATAFERMNVHQGPGTPVQDLHALSLCDRLIGPPSTFSAWASLMGEVPRYQIEAPDQGFGRDSFDVTIGA